MSYILPDDIEAYALMHTSPVPSLLEIIEKETYEKTDCPQMLSGSVEGRFLQFLIKIGGFRRILEIGTFTGYSALIMAEGLPDDGELITCEISEKFAAMAREYFNRSPYGKKIHLKLGPAIETIRSLAEESIDLIFIDADKASYSQYYREGMRLLKKGGIIVADNALWSGTVLSPCDENSTAIAAFNKMVKEDKRTEKVLLTIRDGIYLIRKN